MAIAACPALSCSAGLEKLLQRSSGPVGRLRSAGRHPLGAMEARVVAIRAPGSGTTRRGLVVADNPGSSEPAHLAGAICNPR